MVEVCAIVFSAVIDCSIAFSFDVRLRTLDGTSGKARDKITVIKRSYVRIYTNLSFF